MSLEQNASQVQVNNTKGLSNKDVSGFEWCFKPYIIVLKLFTGITSVNRFSPDKRVKTKLGFSFIFFLFYAVCLLICNCLVNYYFANEYFTRGISVTINNNRNGIIAHKLMASNLPPNNNQSDLPLKDNAEKRIKTSNINYISMIIDMTNKIIMVIGVHCSFFVASHLQNASTQLWCCLSSIESLLQLPTACYRRIRKMVLFGIFLLFLVSE